MSKTGKVYFKIQSYKRWACYELIYRLSKKLDKDPIKVTRDFLYLMGHKAARAKNDTLNLIYSSAKEAAADILDVLMAIDDEEEVEKRYFGSEPHKIY